MGLLGSLNGHAHVVIDGRKEGPYQYYLSVYLNGASKSAVGELTGPMMPLYSTFDGRSDATLELPQGKSIKIVITSIDFEGATFQVSGAVPGY